MNKKLLVVVFAAYLCGGFAVNEEDHWVWSRRSDTDRQSRPFHDEVSAKYQGITLRRNARARDREPTTRRPLPGQPQNDEIDDYTDDEVNTNVGTRNYPYPPFGNGQLFGTNNYPGIGGIGNPVGSGNGILVGPGGPTGIIGRPQSQYPGGFPSNGFIGQPGVGYPTQPGVFGGGNAVGNGFLGSESGLNPGFAGQFGGAGQYPGGQFGGSGQYPGGFAPGGTQYPGGQIQGNQFPAAQYPGGVGPQYTEGYGLAYTGGGGFPGYIPYPGGGRPFGYGSIFNDNGNINRKLQAEGKSAKSSKLTEQVDDKINKAFKKLPN
ncbi:PREDICTED: collagen alpha-2(IV) chain [Rhagoletis zephyria]|uniref:collagen alpha-2(IV) chain n=1 Tax=Rhagoletis zephyria TaxID=28612 RepID=UPI000811289C|nr:PREDICTED: collagen alpha-2(IV) chain [Rhagoletis zephyria]XP_017484232.1 PREDICTED: collagen alpha-2(IV) chain [Rhagoletis zephyria]